GPGRGSIRAARAGRCGSSGRSSCGGSSSGMMRMFGPMADDARMIAPVRGPGGLSPGLRRPILTGGDFGGGSRPFAIFGKRVEDSSRRRKDENVEMVVRGSRRNRDVGRVRAADRGGANGPAAWPAHGSSDSAESDAAARSDAAGAAADDHRALRAHPG